MTTDDQWSDAALVYTAAHGWQLQPPPSVAAQVEDAEQRRHKDRQRDRTDELARRRTARAARREATKGAR